MRSGQVTAELLLVLRAVEERRAQGSGKVNRQRWLGQTRTRQRGIVHSQPHIGQHHGVAPLR